MESNVSNQPKPSLPSNPPPNLSLDAAKQVIAILIEVVIAAKETIIDATQHSPLGGIPSGELYACLMDLLSLDQYTKMIQSFKDKKVVIERNHLLVWVGPMPSKN